MNRSCLDCGDVFVTTKELKSRCPVCHYNRLVQKDLRAASNKPYDSADYRRNKKRLLSQRDAACWICGTTDDLTVDHIVAISFGGSNAIQNLRVLCRKHNSARGNRTDKEWFDAQAIGRA